MASANGEAATITSTTTGGNWASGASWVGGVVPGTADTAIIVSGATVTLTAARTIASVTINTGGVLNIGNVNALTVTGSFLNNGTFTATTGRLYMTGTTGSFTNAGTFSCGAGRIYLYGNATSFGTHTLTGTQVRFYGTANQSIAGFTTTGLVSMLKTGGTATLTGNMTGAGITINGNGGTLNLGTGLTHTTTVRVTLTTGTLNGGSSTLNITGVTTSAWSGTGSRFTAGTSTVNFGAAGNQTLSATATTFNNVIFSNSGIKTLSTGNCTITGTLSMQGTATASAAPTYGANASLIYNTPTSRTAGAEWIATFAASGGVTIANTGTISMNAAKVFNASVPLTINNGSTLTTNNFQLTLGGNFTRLGTFNAGSSPIIIASTMASQTLSGFTTTGLVSMTKTSGMATLSGNISSAGLTVNGNGGTLNLGTALVHTFTGVITLTNGTLNGGSSTINENAVSTTAWNGNGALFVAGTSTVNFGASGNQTLSATATTFYNLTFSNSGVKTLTTATRTVNNILSMEGTATVSVAPNYGANARLQYNTATARTAGPEWITPFAASGGVNMVGTGVITLNAAKVFNASVPLVINSGAALATANFQLNLGGNFTNAGIFTAGSSPIIIDSTMANQSIAGFTTAGLVTMAKTSGTATLTGNVNGSGLTINGTGGTLNLGAGLTHTFTGNWTRTAGTLNGGSSTIRIAGAVSGTGGTFTAATCLVDYNGAAQTVVNLAYYGLGLSGSGTKTFAATTTVSNVMAIASGVVANLGTGLTHTSNGLSFAGALQVIGSWGGTGSGAAHINTTYFTASTGKINNNCSIPNITVQPSAPAATCSGSGVQTLSVVASGSGLTYSWRKAGVALTNGAVVSGQGTATLTLTQPTTADSGSYDVVVTGTCATAVTSTAVTVSVNATPTITSQPLPLSLCELGAGVFNVSTSASSPSYQWQYSTNPATTWTNVNALIPGASGYNTATLSLVSTPLTYSNNMVRCVITGTNGCTTDSNSALLSVYPAPSVGSISANQAICSGGGPNDITLSGATGTIQWQRADDPAFTLNVVNLGTDSTTLTAAEIGSVTTTKYFRAVVSSGVCSVANSSVASISINSTTWTAAAGGSWSHGAPNSTKAAIISYDFTSSSDLVACSLAIDNGANVRISAGDNLDLYGALNIISGTLTLSSNANLIQDQEVVNSGSIIVERETAPLMRQDYVLWSAPVDGQQLQSFSPNTLSNRFYTFDGNLGAAGQYVATTATNNFEDGVGYLIRMPNNHPATPLSWMGTFSGVPHNGPYSMAVSSGKYSAVGNPYPSTIDADAFIDDNGITEALYFWRKTNNAASSSYATYTTAGGVSNSSADPLLLAPNGVIQVGQGFIVKATSSTIEFANSMRLNDNSNQFLRSMADDKNRIWLNLTSNTGYFGQMLLAYMDNATLGVDAAIDGKYINDFTTALTSIIDNEEYTIQGRPLPFDAADVVPLGFKSGEAGTFTISVNQVDGLFLEDNQTIYLKDNLTNTMHNLSLSPYVFASEVGVFNSRFELAFENLLTVEDQQFNQDSVVVYKHGNEAVVHSNVAFIDKIEVYDVNGRLLISKDQVNAAEARFNLPATKEVLLVKVISEENQALVKKIVN